MSSEDPVAFTITVAGIEIGAAIAGEVRSIEVEQGSDGSARASIVLRNWDPEADKAEDALLDCFAVARTLTIALGYGRSVEKVFEGAVAAITVRMPTAALPELTVCADGHGAKPRAGNPAATFKAGDNILSAEIVDRGAADSRYGTMECAGDAAICVGSTVYVSGLGRNHDGAHKVTRVAHQVVPGSYTTRMGLGTA